MKTSIKTGISLIIMFFFINLSGQMNVITYNIRLNTDGDGENAWPHRKQDVVNLLKFHKADIFCLQEALHEQVTYVDDAFPAYDFVGVGRDDGNTKGEYSPVFYNSRRFKNNRSGHFWLAEDPSAPSRGWDAACIRICSWVELTDQESGEVFMVFNTHFDHVGVNARKNAADLIIRKTEEMAGTIPLILCGDFNLPPGSEPVHKLSSHFSDAFKVTELPPHGATGTWAGFSYDDKKGDRIDYVFVTEDFRVLRYAALTDSRDRKFFSDHLPVLVEVMIEN